jgi:hypothetical protein
VPAPVTETSYARPGAGPSPAATSPVGVVPAAARAAVLTEALSTSVWPAAAGAYTPTRG